MNLPNKLTVLRIFLVPFFVAFLMWTTLPYHFLWAFIVFAVAAITDAIDGKIARKYNLVTDFGKFLDPLADKILVVSALVCFIPFHFASAIAVVIILAREFLVTSLRLVAAGKGTVIAASKFGKIKTVSQMVSIVLTLLFATYLQFFFDVKVAVILLIISNTLIWISTLFTILSGADYLWKNRHFLSQT